MLRLIRVRPSQCKLGLELIQLTACLRVPLSCLDVGQSLVGGGTDRLDAARCKVSTCDRIASVVAQGAGKKVPVADADIPQHVPCELVRNALPPALASRLLQVPPLPPWGQPRGCQM